MTCKQLILIYTLFFIAAGTVNAEQLAELYSEQDLIDFETNYPKLCFDGKPAKPTVNREESAVLNLFEKDISIKEKVPSLCKDYDCQTFDVIEKKKRSHLKFVPASVKYDDNSEECIQARDNFVTAFNLAKVETFEIPKIWASNYWARYYGSLSNSQSPCSENIADFFGEDPNQISVCTNYLYGTPTRLDLYHSSKLYCPNTKQLEFDSCAPLDDFDSVAIALTNADSKYSEKETQVLKMFSRLKRPLYFGGSATGESLNSFAGRAVYHLVAWGAGINEVPSGSNPAKLAVKKIYDEYIKIVSEWKYPRNSNNYEGSETAPPGLTKIKNMGSRQIIKMLNKEFKTSIEQQLYKKSSAILSVDGYYWDAAINFESCGYGESQFEMPGYPNVRTDVEFVIQSLVEKTKKDGKFLFLATVPLDTVKVSKVANSDFNYKNYHEEGLGGYELTEKRHPLQVWRPGIEDCVKSINATIKKYCKNDDDCRYIDSYQLNERLLEKNYAALPSQFDGKDYYDFRTDGVHFSIWGAEQTSEIIYNMLVNPTIL